MAEDNNSINVPSIGMKLGKSADSLKQGEYSLMVNGNIQSMTGEFLKLTNESSNLLCNRFNDFKVINTQPVTSLGLTFYFLVNPDTNESEIGIIYDQHNTDSKDRQVPCKDCNNPLIEDVPLELQIQRERCQYFTFVNADCLGFSINHPIKSWVKVDDCNIRLYFVQKGQPPRYIDYEDYQKITLLNCPKIESNSLDCDKIKIFKDTCIPIISYIDVVAGGNNTAGTLQFAVAYSDAYSNPLTSYFYVSNPIDIWDKSKTILIDGKTDYPVSKSVKLRIDNINSEFDWFNLVVLKTVNTTTTPYLVETFSNTGSSLDYTYSGIDKNLIKNLSIDEILKRNPVYNEAIGITESNGYSFLYELKEPRIINLQPVINKLQLQWQTIELNEGDYANPIIAEKYPSELRDEVYAFSFEPVVTNGKKMPRFHIPGRAAKPYDLQSVAKLNGLDNPDVFGSSACSPDEKPHLRWQVYNTATNLGGACGNNPPSNPSGNTQTITCEKLLYRKCVGGGLYFGSVSDAIAKVPGTEIPNGHFCDTCFNNLPNLPNLVVTNQVTHNITATGNVFGEGCVGLHSGFGLNCVCEFSVKCDTTFTYSTNTNSCPEGSNTITAFFDCDKNTQFYQDPTTLKYYSTYNPSGNILSNEIEPCTIFPCSSIDPSCQSAIFSAYPTGTVVDNDCNVVIDTYGGTEIKNFYNPSGYLTTPDWIDTSTPTNTFCDNAIGSDSLLDCDNPYLSKLNNSSESTWYRFTAASDAQQFTITSIYNQTNGFNFTVSLYSTDTGNCVDNVLVETQTGSNPYFIFQNLTNGGQYFISVTATTAPTNNTNDFYYICTSIPTPVSSETIHLPNTGHVRCHYTINYDVCVDKCNAKIYEYGDFAYWESTERYPCNMELWGDLADTPIRHHKFPDCLISPHFKNPQHNLSLQGQDLFQVKDKIYPIGVVVDVEQVKTLLLEAELLGLITNEERLSICGYRILRSNRRGNESIIAKGLLYDVWQYKDNVYNNPKTTQQNILYPNYPYNDRNPDPFNLQKKLETIISPILPIEHPYVSNGYVNNKYTFFSANTLFNNPSLGTEVKLELETFGISEGKYTEVLEHAKYQYAGIGAVRAAFTFAALEAMFDAIGEINAGGIISAGILSLLGSPIWGSKVPEHYYDWLDIIKKLAPFKNFAWMFTSIGNYSDYVDNGLPGHINLNPVQAGNIRRALQGSQYLTPGIVSVSNNGVQSKFNNFRREGSVYLNLDNPDKTSQTSLYNNFNPTAIVDNSRWYPGDANHDCSFIGNEYSNISSYYASIKNNLPSQYGQVAQIEYFDTGYNGIIDWNNEQSTSCDPIFGGDTYIGRFSPRRQQSFFIQDRVGYPPNTDVLYNELSNIGYPQFYFSYPTGVALSDTASQIQISELYGDVAVNNASRRDYNFNCQEDSGAVWLNNAGKGAFITTMILANGNALAGIGVLITMSQLGSTFNPGHPFQPFNNPHPQVYPSGKFFLYSYGVPSFIQESDYNVDLRYGENYKEKDFYPHVGDVTTWVQPEAGMKGFNMINYDNTYFYNRDYSKPNRENLGYTLNPNFEQTKEDCKALHPNRLIYSLQDNDNNDRFDGNLVFLTNNTFDFPKSAGKLKIVKGVDSGKVLVIQEDQSSIFNSYISQENQQISQSTLGSNTLFNKSIPSQYITTDLGFAGSQTSAIVTTEFGTFWVDNKRGQVIEYNPNPKIGLNDIVSEEDAWWFKQFLPFKILKDFPTVDIDNSYKYFGMAIVYNAKKKVVIFTKRDSQLRPEYKKKVIFDGVNFKFGDLIIEPTNSKYFCNQSLSIGYSPTEKNFISFYTFTPNYYVEHQSYIDGGWNYSPVDNNTALGLWSFGLTNKSFQVYNGTLEPFIIQYGVNSPIQNKILDSVKYSHSIRRYQDDLSYGIHNNITYNHALIYNDQQSTGDLSLVLKEKNNIFQLTKYPKVVGNTTEILVENTENWFNINNLKDVSLSNGQPLMQYECSNPYLTLNNSAISLKPSYYSTKLSNNYFNIRLENSKYSNYNFIHNLSIAKETPSI